MSADGPVGFASTLPAGRRRAPEDDAIRIRARRRPADDAAFRVRRNVERVRLEMAVRAFVGFLVLVVNSPGASRPCRGCRSSSSRSC